MKENLRDKTLVGSSNFVATHGRNVKPALNWAKAKIN
jgi:hypothetical protein